MYCVVLTIFVIWKFGYTPLTRNGILIQPNLQVDLKSEIGSSGRGRQSPLLEYCLVLTDKQQEFFFFFLVSVGFHIAYPRLEA